MSNKPFHSAFAVDAFIRSEYTRSALSISTSCKTAPNFCKARKSYAAVSTETGFCKGPSSFIANACAIVSNVSCLFVSIQRFPYTVWSKGLVVPRKMRPWSVPIRFELRLLPVDSVTRLFLALSIFVLDVELIGGSALVVKISCWSDEVQV